MKKKKRLEFILDDNKYRKLVFRFYPRSSTCHSFNDQPPKSWEEVYKVYYHYKIVKVWKSDHEQKLMFNSGCDECSIIDEIANRIKLITEGYTVYKGKTRDGDEFSIPLLDDECFPFGDGVSWTISKCTAPDKYSIALYDYDNIGYRFTLTKEKLAEFGQYLESCCEYMLAHGDPI